MLSLVAALARKRGIPRWIENQPTQTKHKGIEKTTNHRRF